MRKYYLDNIRWMTVVLVVIYHVFYMYNAEGIPGGAGKITSLNVQYYDFYLYAVYPWFMMLLFIVSGICSRLYLEYHSEFAFVRSRTTRLLVPSTIGLFAFQFLQGYVSMSLSNAFETMQAVPVGVKYLIMVLSGTGVLWYAQLLWLFSVILVVIRKFEKDRLWQITSNVTLPVLILLTIVLWGAAQLLNAPVVVVYRGGFYGAAFLLGYFVFSHEIVIERLKDRFWFLLSLALVLGIAFCILYFGENYAAEPINRSLLFVSFGWFASLAVLGGAARYGDFHNSFTDWMTRHNFGLYVFHYLGVSAVAFLFRKVSNPPATVTYLVTLIAGFLAGYLLEAVISGIPFFRWAVLGIRKERQNHVS